jgi:hypothetical protein
MYSTNQKNVSRYGGYLRTNLIIIREQPTKGDPPGWVLAEELTTPRPVAGEHDNEPSGSIKGEERFDELSDY